MKTLDKLNPKKALMKKALTQMQQMKAKDMFQMFNQKLLPVFQINTKVNFKATKLLVNDKEWYAILFRDT